LATNEKRALVLQYKHSPTLLVPASTPSNSTPPCEAPMASRFAPTARFPV